MTAPLARVHRTLRRLCPGGLSSVPGTRASAISSRRRGLGGPGSGAAAAETEVVMSRTGVGGVATGVGAMPVLCAADTGTEGSAAPVGDAECVLSVTEEAAAIGSVPCMAPSRGIDQWEVGLVMPADRDDFQQPFTGARFREVLCLTPPDPLPHLVRLATPRLRTGPAMPS